MRSMMIAITAVGAVSYTLLPMAALPDIDTPVVQVTAQLPRVDPTTVANAVTTQLERQFGQLPGVSQMRSSSGAGYAEITIGFDRSHTLEGPRATSRPASTPRRASSR